MCGCRERIYADLSVGACVYYVFVAACDFHSLNASAAHTHTHAQIATARTHEYVFDSFINSCSSSSSSNKRRPLLPRLHCGLCHWLCLRRRLVSSLQQQQKRQHYGSSNLKCALATAADALQEMDAKYEISQCWK